MLGSFRYGIFSSSAHNISLDRRCLIGLGAKKVSTYSSWEIAIREIDTDFLDFALVDEKLDDITGIECIARLKSHVKKSVPMVIVTNDRRKDSVLDSISVGCGGYVLRPYSIQTLQRHLNAACHSATPDEIEMEMLEDARDLVSKGQFDDALECLEEIVEEEDQAVKYYNKGMGFLADEKYGKAIIAFNKAVAINEMYAEAYKAMADAYKGKGKTDKVQECLTKAADLYAVQEQMDKAKKVFIEILQNEPDAMNPFNRLGVKLRKDGDYQGAIRAYTQGLGITPNDPNLYYNLARAYMFAEDYPNARIAVKRSIDLDPDMEHAVALLARIQGKDTVISTPITEAKKDMSGRVLMDSD